MNPSPLRALVARHICVCSRSSLPVQTLSRLSASTARRTVHNASPVPTYGSAELLRRRYQSTPNSVQDEKAEKARIVKRMKYSAYGIVLCSLALFGTIYLYPTSKDNSKKSNRDGMISFDAPPAIPGVAGTPAEEAVEVVPTGTSTIPFFPKHIRISSEAPPNTPAAANEGMEAPEYQLVGLGIRTVSIFGIQVYVVGLYIAVPDIAVLQERLIRRIDPVATTLVPGEKSKLKEDLLDPVVGEDIWNEILLDQGIRTAFRIVPTRNTDFMHMRDGFVRGITARSAHFTNDKADKSFSDESFGQSVNDLKSMFGGGSAKKIPKGETLLLARDTKGKLSAIYEDKQGNRVKMGDVADERIGRLLWLNYLAGKSVSSEPARQSVIDGVMEYVERPVGTVATQVI